MTLPVPPDAAMILQNSIVTLRDVLLPLTKDDEYARFNGGLLVGALEYALASLEEDRASKNRTGWRRHWKNYGQHCCRLITPN